MIWTRRQKMSLSDVMTFLISHVRLVIHVICMLSGALRAARVAYRTKIQLPCVQSGEGKQDVMYATRNRYSWRKL
jgi:hypothetical protein